MMDLVLCFFTHLALTLPCMMKAQASATCTAATRTRSLRLARLTHPVVPLRRCGLQVEPVCPLDRSIQFISSSPVGCPMPPDGGVHGSRRARGASSLAGGKPQAATGAACNLADENISASCLLEAPNPIVYATTFPHLLAPWRPFPHQVVTSSTKHMSPAQLQHFTAEYAALAKMAEKAGLAVDSTLKQVGALCSVTYHSCHGWHGARSVEAYYNPLSDARREPLINEELGKRTGPCHHYRADCLDC